MQKSYGGEILIQMIHGHKRGQDDRDNRQIRHSNRSYHSKREHYPKDYHHRSRSPIFKGYHSDTYKDNGHEDVKQHSRKDYDTRPT